MLHLLHHQQQQQQQQELMSHHLLLDPVPPIPPRTHSRPSSRQHTQSNLVSTNHQTNNKNNSSVFRLDDLPAPDREWQLLENIGDGTYGEVFRVSYRLTFRILAEKTVMHLI